MNKRFRTVLQCSIPHITLYATRYPLERRTFWLVCTHSVRRAKWNARQQFCTLRDFLYNAQLIVIVPTMRSRIQFLYPNESVSLIRASELSVSTVQLLNNLHILKYELTIQFLFTRSFTFISLKCVLYIIVCFLFTVISRQAARGLKDGRHP